MHNDHHLFRLQVIVVTLIKSIPMLLDVLVLAAFYFSIFGVLTLQLFSGKLRGRCAAPDFSNSSTGQDGVLLDVQYIVPPDQEEEVCSGPLVESITWRNVSGMPVADGDMIGTGRRYAAAWLG